MNSGLRIVLVEDNVTESLIWEQSLEKVCEVYRTYWPDIFSNPQDAFESIQLDNRVAAIICDWKFRGSGMDGVAFYRRIKYQLGKDIPFLLVSKDEGVLSVTEVGVEKLVNPDKLEVAVDKVADLVEQNLQRIRWNRIEDDISGLKQNTISMAELLVKIDEKVSQKKGVDKFVEIVAGVIKKLLGIK
jgi:CheY-like chemotaxis protein